MTSFRNIAILFIFNIIYYIDSNSTDQNLDAVLQYSTEKRDVMPVIYANGSHYDVGMIIGYTFKYMIKDFLDKYEPLKRYENVVKTEKGKENYKNCFDVTNKHFPQYINELKGIAQGANVTFEQLFLVHMDEIIMIGTNDYKEGETNLEISTILANSDVGKLIGYSVDVHKDTINHYYIVHAHIIPTTNESSGIFKAREEKWTSLTYAGMLSGYMGGFNYYGLVYIIQKSLPKELNTNKIPYVFLTRALLASHDDVNEIRQILKNFNVGTANNFIVQFGFIKNKTILYEFNVKPPKGNSSESDIEETSHLEEVDTVFHTNNLQILGYSFMVNSCWKFWCNKNLFWNQKKTTEKKNFQNIRDLLINSSNPYSTMINGIFDFNQMTWSIWTRNPKFDSPFYVLPLQYKYNFSTIFNNN